MHEKVGTVLAYTIATQTKRITSLKGSPPSPKGDQITGCIHDASLRVGPYEVGTRTRLDNQAKNLAILGNAPKRVPSLP